METKKVGAIIIILTLILGGFIFYLVGLLEGASVQEGCVEDRQCREIQESISYSHLGIGILSAVFALGVYLLVFSKGEMEVLRRVEETRREKDREELFSLILQFLEPAERQVLSVVRKEPGITQSTLAMRADLSRAKTSQILQELEARDVVERRPKGKTYEIHLKKQL